MASEENVTKQAKNYNYSLTAESNDDILKDKFKKDFNITEGDMGIKEITTDTGNMGLTSDGVYVDNGVEVAGYIDRYTTGKSLVHISPKYTLGNVVDFRAVAGHELNHVYHNYLFKSAYVKAFSETVAYKYTVSVYQNVGRYKMALDVMNIAKKLGFTGVYPRSYNLGNTIKSMWLY